VEHEGLGLLAPRMRGGVGTRTVFGLEPEQELSDQRFFLQLGAAVTKAAMAKLFVAKASVVETAMAEAAVTKTTLAKSTMTKSLVAKTATMAEEFLLKELFLEALSVHIDEQILGATFIGRRIRQIDGV